jgi:SAM-dependent methyltransferase
MTGFTLAYDTGTGPTEPGWQEFFSHPQFMRFSSAILTEERTALEVTAISDWLGLRPGTSVLDLGCGYGRIAVPLAKSGCIVTGLDGNSTMLRKAAEYAGSAAVDITFVHRDMQDAEPLPGEFDAVVNMSTAFGYADDPDGDLAALESVCKALRPGGLFLIDLENRDSKIRTARSARFEMAGTTIECRREFDALSGRWREAMSWVQDGTPDSAVFSVRLYSATEVIDLLGRSGLAFVRAWGWFDGSPYDIDSRRMILLARRPWPVNAVDEQHVRSGRAAGRHTFRS